MEILAYLHHACAYEALAGSDVEPTLSDRVTVSKFSGAALIRVLSLLVSLSILSLASAAMAIQLGDQGAAVSTLQTQLKSTGCFSGAVDGIFGPQTDQAVKCLQSRNGLSADGVVGTQTQAVLTSSGASSPAQPAAPVASKLLRPGDSGDDVSQLQARLADLNYFTNPVTGHFGPLTADAVKRFQTDRGLVADGVVGAQTSKALGFGSVAAAPSAPTPIPPGTEIVSNRQPLRVGSSGAEVEALQTQLKTLGFFNGEITGYYGPVTQAAVARYQQSRGLQATGVADASTLNAIGVIAGSPTSRRYMVVVPQEDVNTLARVKRVVPGALPEKSKLGDYVRAGTFFDRDSADRQSSFLRGRGLDARVAYR
jgi:peptidoglycan hydrolase-like protein with peptidoglycan-binding domain